MWLAAARYQALQAHTDECHQEMELDVQGAPAQSREPEVRHARNSTDKRKHTNLCLLFEMVKNYKNRIAI